MVPECVITLLSFWGGRKKSVREAENTLFPEFLQYAAWLQQ